jgi:hypothetical protein
MAETPLWIQIATLAVDTLVPITVVVVGLVISRHLTTLESNLALSRTLMERRSKAFDDLGPILNHIFCYATYVGRWRELTPPELRQKKREADALFASMLPLWSSEVVQDYRAFMDSCFLTFQGVGKEALLRANIVRHKQSHGSGWKTEWDSFFAPTHNKRADVQAKYAALLTAIGSDLGARTNASRIASLWSQQEEPVPNGQSDEVR